MQTVSAVAEQAVFTKVEPTLQVEQTEHTVLDVLVQPETWKEPAAHFEHRAHMRADVAVAGFTSYSFEAQELA